MRVEAGIDGAQSDKRPNQQSRANQQDQGQGHFADDEQRAGLVLTEPGAGAPAALRESGGQVGAGDIERRDEAEQNAVTSETGQS